MKTGFDELDNIIHSMKNKEVLLIAGGPAVGKTTLAIDIINSVNFHKSVIEGCDKTLRDLNPEYAEKQQQQDEINTLKQNMDDMRNSMAELMRMNKELLTRFNASSVSTQSEETSSVTSKTSRK